MDIYIRINVFFLVKITILCEVGIMDFLISINMLNSLFNVTSSCDCSIDVFIGSCYYCLLIGVHTAIHAQVASIHRNAVTTKHCVLILFAFICSRCKLHDVGKCHCTSYCKGKDSLFDLHYIFLSVFCHLLFFRYVHQPLSKN